MVYNSNPMRIEARCRTGVQLLGPAIALALVSLVALVALATQAPSASAQDRTLGLDVSAWQGNISQTTWNNLRAVNDRQFVYIRSSRGGTTGFYNQSDPNNNNNQNTFSQRYDDPYFVQNITRATAAGMLAGAYHFSRPDIVASTPNSGGIANTGTDEADHFLQMAGAWMRPGYLLPVFDLETGQAERTRNELAQFSIDFSDRIYDATGVRPVMYINGNYANYLQGASTSLRNELVEAFPDLWVARYANQANPEAIPIQTGNPNDTFAPLYGPWDDPPQPAQPWTFWQYASTVRMSAFNNGNSNLDGNVAQGGMEFVKDRLVPALWTTAESGDWSTLANWNSGQTPIAPVQGRGQVARVGPLTLPSVRLPAQNDTVVLDRADANIVVTLSNGDHHIRKLFAREALDITGGSLRVGYVPSPDSTPLSAQFSAPVSLQNGAQLAVHTLQVDASHQFTLSDATLTFDTLILQRHPAAPAAIVLQGDLWLSPLDNAAAVVSSTPGSGQAGTFDLGGARRVLTIADGHAEIDVSLDVPLVNGSLTKAGPGTLALSSQSTYQGDTLIEEGTLTLRGAALPTEAAVRIAAGAHLDLDFFGAPNVIDKLFIDGIPQSPGLWGGMGSGAPFTSSQLSGTGLLQVLSTETPLLPGDFDGDGDVDGLDLLIWQNTPAASPPKTERFTLWEANFGNPFANPTASPTAAAVPEPGSLALLLAVVLSPLASAPRRRRPRGNG
jgi:autotransporter-associated beta strand protein